MKKLGAKGMKWIKIFHLLCISMWTGSGLALGVISWAGPILLKNQIDAVYVILQMIDIGLMIPLVIGTLLTGLGFSIFTNWGFFKHKWITVKWGVFVLQLLIGALFLGPLIRKNTSITKIEQLRSFNNPEFLHNQALIHLGNTIQLLLLILLIGISVLKPWGKSRAKKITKKYSVKS